MVLMMEQRRRERQEVGRRYHNFALDGDDDGREGVDVDVDVGGCGAESFFGLEVGGGVSGAVWMPCSRSWNEVDVVVVVRLGDSIVVQGGGMLARG